MMNLRFFSTLGLSLFGLGMLFGAAQSAHAATVSAGTLIKASSPAVYYFSANGKRYAFPDQSTYNSWYSDFSAVQTISDTDLAQIPFGGLVTIRPGSRMVKITTDPRTYAVARGGVLRWVQSEALARSLYGENWNRMISDVPDAFFTNYRIQTEIAQSSDFSATTEQNAISTIDADLQARATVVTPPVVTTPTSTPVTPPVTTPTSTTPTTSSTTPTPPPMEGRIEVLTTGPYQAGDVLNILTSVTRGFADRISFTFGTSSPITCSTLPCQVEVTVPEVQTTSTIQLQAVLSIGEGTSLVAATTTKEITISPTPVSNLIEVIVPGESIYGTTYRIRVQGTADFSPRTIKVMVDGILKRECTQRRVCEFAEIETARGGTRHSVYGIVTDVNEQRFLSPTVSFPVVE